MIKCSSHGVWVVEGGAGHANSGKLNEQELCVRVTRGVRKQEDKVRRKAIHNWETLSRVGGLGDRRQDLGELPALGVTWLIRQGAQESQTRQIAPSRAKCRVIFLMEPPEPKGSKC